MAAGEKPGAAAMSALQRSLLLIALFWQGAIFSAEPAALSERWSLHDENSQRVLNHSIWEKFLSDYLVQTADGIHRMRYESVTLEDRGYLRLYLDDLKRTPVSTLRRAEQRAYWINLYNALTVKLILEWYPVSSIQSIDITPGWFTKGPWGAKVLQIEGQNLSLDDIQNQILLPIWKDPRLHYALNRASQGGPNLAADIYSSGNTEAQLEQAARSFINHPRAVNIVDGKLIVSELYKWHAQDFGGSDEAVIAHLRQYAEPTLQLQLEAINKINGYSYDWLLDRP
tara:strand:+ start:5933 stop:6784 length:852 start_codon:yes stop_codon:yes gene_type:complete